MKKYIEPKTIYIALDAEDAQMLDLSTDLPGTTTDDGPSEGEIEIDSKHQGIWGWGNDSDM